LQALCLALANQQLEYTKRGSCGQLGQRFEIDFKK
jgi:hypothetical protein